MKKILSVLIIGLLCVSYGVTGALPGQTAQTIGYRHRIHKTTITVPTISLTEINDEYMTVSLEQGTSFLAEPGKPLLPKILYPYELPFGATNITVTITMDTIHLGKIIQVIAPTPQPWTPQATYKLTPDETTVPHSVYTENKMFPREWYSYNIGCGLNTEFTHVTHLSINLYPIRYNPVENILLTAESAQITISYDTPSTSPFSATSDYDLLIIAPPDFTPHLQDLVDHKNSHNIKTILKNTEDIYREYDGQDKPEQIKYCIKDALETWGIKYVLLAGGLKSLIYAKPKDDKNQGSQGWHIPARYVNVRDYEPGYLCDLYYADIYREGGEFDDWDSNGNGVIGEWRMFNPDVLDLYPDVAVGRLACRNTREIQDVVEKIITYETGLCDPSWFNKIIGISGDSFLDQDDIGIPWDTTTHPDGSYQIYAQSMNDDGETGPLETVSITLDKTQATSLHFNHEDHLKVTGYPAPPIAEIVSVSDGDILGNTDYTYIPDDGEAYCNDFSGWGNIDYEDGVLIIRGKSYDPQPYGNLTHFHVWIEDSIGTIIFSEWKNNTKTFAEGDWIVGEKLYRGRGGAMYYMPEDFEKVLVSTANGLFTGIPDVIDVYSDGSGFLIFSVHGSPGSVGNHLPGIPGNRHESYVNGLTVTNLQLYFPFIKPPVFPLSQLENTDKLPVTVISLGCHDGNFNVSLVTSILDLFLPLSMHTSGHPIPECLCWSLVKLPQRGAIASIGYTGYGWGHLGEWHTLLGLDGYISTEFFRQYGTYGLTILGETHSQTITEYITHFKEYYGPFGDDPGWDLGDQMTVQGWALFGDPSLHIGGIAP